MTKAIAYLRTSSAANVGSDSDKRQRAAIQAYAAANGIELAEEFYDAAVSGADPIETRPGFAAMLSRIEGNGIRLVLVEDASRFARELMAQELGVIVMQQRGVRVVTASGDDMTDCSDPARVMFRQIAGAFHQYEKTRLVAKMRVARDRASAKLGRRVEGGKGFAVHRPEIIEAIRAIREGNPKATLQTISAELAIRGMVTDAGKPLDISHVSRLIKRHQIA